jgi:hypothetical protein
MDAARVMATHTTTLRLEAGHFAQARDQIAKARQGGMNALERSAVKLESWRGARLGAWELTSTNAERAKLYTGVIEASEEELKRQVAIRQLTEEHQRRLADARSRVDLRLQKLSQTAKSLAQLAEKPSLKEERSFYLQYFKAVGEEYKKLRDEANDRSEEAKNGAVEKAKEAMPPDDEVPSVPPAARVRK